VIRLLFRSADGQVDADTEVADLPELLRRSDGVVWADLSQPDEREQKLLGDVFGFHPLAIEDALNQRLDTPKIDDYGDYLFIVAQSVAYHARSERLQLSEVDIFLGRSYVVSVHEQPVPSIDELFERAAQNAHLTSRGADFLAHTILDGLVDRLLPAVEEMDETLDDLEQRILLRPQPAQLQEVLLLKRNTLRLRRSILPQRDLVNRLSRGEFGDLIDREALMFYRDVYDHIVRVEEMLEGLRDLADSALSSYLSAVNNRMNEVMKAMSVVAVIFLPLTLIASIYGTNLDFTPWGLPGIDGGFALMLASMVAVAAGLISYFRSRGWF
jgi:magnesium transporter